MNTNLLSHSFPGDWETAESSFHGVSKCARLRGYIATLLLNHRQYQFGPFRVSQLEAANAYDALMKYFLAFTKAKPQPNCPSESFFQIKDTETEEKYGRDRLQKLRAKFREEYKAAGLDLETELAFRVDYVLNSCSIKKDRVVSHADRRRQKALVQLEAMHIRSLKGASLVLEQLRLLGLSKEQRNDLDAPITALLEAHTKLSASFEVVLGDAKQVLGMNTQASVNSQLSTIPEE